MLSQTGKRVLILILIFLTLLPMPICEAGDVKIPDGAVGIWWIPDLHIRQPVYRVTWDKWQEVIDAPESALMETWLTARMIADHSMSRGMDNTGRWNMSYIDLGDHAYFITAEGKALYECYLTAVVDVGTWGFTINGKVLQPASSADIGNRCCVGKDSTRNYIAVFKYVKEIK